MADPNWKAKKDPKVWRRANKKYQQSAKGKAHIKAKSKIRTLVRNGTLKKPSACPKCHRSGVRIIFHHTHGYDSENHTKGVWMCDQCHAKHDKKRSGKAIGAAVKRSLAKKKKG